MKVKIEIKNRWTGKLIFEYESENNTIKETVLKAIEAKANLSGANLSWANLSGANLSEANLSGANLSKADLSEANLSWADLSGANLSGANLSEANLSEANLSEANLSKADLSEANLSEANLSVIKADFFYVLLNAKKEVGFLKQAVIDGKIDGSTYSGECRCLSGTVEKSAIIHNGQDQEKNVKRILDCRASTRPAERFFLAIRPNDTPENNQASKIVLGWIEQFEMLIQ